MLSITEISVATRVLIFQIIGTVIIISLRTVSFINYFLIFEKVTHL